MLTLHNFNFTTWDHYLQKQIGHSIPWHIGSDHLEHPLYATDFFKMLHEFKASDFYDHNYQRTLMQKNMPTPVTEADIITIANESHDFFKLRATLSMIIENEKYFEGLWAAMLEKGILQKLLKQLNLTTPKDFPMW
ncbi:hypothetical protein G7084_01030 [Weissella coleopterorum]|uniref:Uncharacterized protein n=1 Tax=Weissella coleopterorum TaxID=2714949 RepID=A0A6G8AYE7_9LACO|nr:DUF6508 domain-containing protein [Weissella coleopterorum]QIL50026.1 hypothetical protein G7084_01030 [Weissella coleopterorum]